MDLNLIDDKGQKASTVAGSDALFGHDYNEALIHQIVTAYQANARQGTRAQKGRSEINKSHRKPWTAVVPFLSCAKARRSNFNPLA